MRILFVEFHRAFRQAASWLLEQRSDLKVVAQAGSVAEGREKMAEGGIDAAIVDIPLPDEGAAEIVRELHEANPSIPVLVMTAIEDREVHERMLGAGANEVLDQRNTLEEIAAAVRRLEGEEPEQEEMRVLVAYEESYLAYRLAITNAIRALRPHVVVGTIDVRALEAALERMDPHVVTCNRQNTVDAGSRAGWLTLAPEPEEASEVCLFGRRRELYNPGLEDLLGVIDEVEELIRSGRELGGC